MSPKKRINQTDDRYPFANEEEAEELDQLAELIAADRFQPSDDHFWDRMQQRIIAELEVTPAPRRRSVKSRFSELLRKMRERVPQSSAQLVAGLFATLMLLFIGYWLLSQTTPTEQEASQVARTFREQLEPQTTINPVVRPMSLPEELWMEGFFSNSALVARDLESEDSRFDDQDRFDNGNLASLTSSLVSRLVAGMEEYQLPDYSLNSLPSWQDELQWSSVDLLDTMGTNDVPLSWTLETLTHEELLELVAMLGG